MPPSDENVSMLSARWGSGGRYLRTDNVEGREATSSMASPGISRTGKARPFQSEVPTSPLYPNFSNVLASSATSDVTMTTFCMALEFLAKSSAESTLSKRSSSSCSAVSEERVVSTSSNSADSGAFSSYGAVKIPEISNTHTNSAQTALCPNLISFLLN